MTRHNNELLINGGANFGLTNSEQAVARTHNKGLKEMAGEVLNQTFVLSIYICAGRQFCAFYPPLL